MGKRAFVIAAGLCLMVSSRDLGHAAEFTLKLLGGWSRMDGGDLNESIAGWKRYYQDRQSPFFSATYTIDSMGTFFEGGAEISYRFSPGWSMGLAVLWTEQKRSGLISSRLEKHETTPLFPSGTRSLSVEEETSKRASFSLTGLPVLVTIDYWKPVSQKFWLVLGVGGGVIWGRLRYGEDYLYFFNTTEEESTPASSFMYVERFRSWGGYEEQTRSRGFCLFTRLGLHFKASSFLSFLVELTSRSAELKNWEGESTDTYEWQQTWGPWGAFSEGGKSTQTISGRLWQVEVHSRETGASYPRLVFSDEEPASFAYTSVRPARINFSGLGLRVGISMEFGPRKGAENRGNSAL